MTGCEPTVSLSCIDVIVSDVECPVVLISRLSPCCPVDLLIRRHRPLSRPAANESDGRLGGGVRKPECRRRCRRNCLQPTGRNTAFHRFPIPRDPELTIGMCRGWRSHHVVTSQAPFTRPIGQSARLAAKLQLITRRPSKRVIGCSLADQPPDDPATFSRRSTRPCTLKCPKSGSTATCSAKPDSG